MSIPPAVQEFLTAGGWGAVRGTQFVGGGCINDGQCLTTNRGQQFFFKSNPAAPADLFEREAEGLRALAVPDGPPVPRPLLVGTTFLLLDYLPPTPAAPNAWEHFGQQLAALHGHTRADFGFDHDNYIGRTPQPNPWTREGVTFFAEHRLLHQGRLARSHGRLDPGALQTLERLAARLGDLIPAQPASLIHGDLWSGNVHFGHAGQAALIDPAAHYGWAEADLAMTALFGGVPERFYAAYTAARPLVPGYRQRFDLYNLYHLLNHLNLFGDSYQGSVLAILRRYG